MNNASSSKALSAPQNQIVTRRGFIAAAASAVVVAGCSGGSSKAKPPKGTAEKSKNPAKVAALDSPSTTLTKSPFALGVASGDPLADSVICWTRLVIDPLAADGLGAIDGESHRLVWEMATDEQFDHLIATELVTASSKFAHSVHVDAQGLQPDTWYWYRFRIGDFTSPKGRTRTTPATKASVDEFRLAFVSCQERIAGYYTAYEALAADDLDLVLHLGDYIYENGGGSGERSAPGTLDGTLAAFRNQYGAYKSDAHLQAAHQRFPWVVTWDDHEVENNYASTFAGGTDQGEFEQRRTHAYQAYWEHQPLRLGPPKDASLQLYRAVHLGKLATIFVLDGRQFRDDQVCGDKIALDRATCPEIKDADREMLGTEQAAWLSDGLADTESVWKVLGNQTILAPLVIGQLVLNPDQWDGYPAARQRLLDRIDTDSVDNVIILTGDIHSAGAANVHLEPEDRSTTIVAHEFVGTSISSPGLSEAIPNSEALVTMENLGIEYINVKDHGYGRCIVTPDSWRTDFVMVESTQTPTSTSRVDASFVVNAGTAGMAPAN